MIKSILLGTMLLSCFGCVNKSIKEQDQSIEMKVFNETDDLLDDIIILSSLDSSYYFAQHIDSNGKKYFEETRYKNSGKFLRWFDSKGLISHSIDSLYSDTLFKEVDYWQGNVRYIKNYKNGVEIGEWYLYYEGRLKSIVNFSELTFKKTSKIKAPLYFAYFDCFHLINENYRVIVIEGDVSKMGLQDSVVFQKGVSDKR